MSLDLDIALPLRVDRKLTGGVVVVDDAGTVVEWSPAALRLHGYQDVAEVRRHLSSFATTFTLTEPQGMPVPYENWPLSRMLRGETVDNLELLLRRVDTGQSWFISYSGIRLAAPGAGKSWYLLLMQDVTEWYRTGDALRESQIRLSGVVETASDGILTLDEAGTIETANPAVFDLFGHQPAGLVGRPIGTVMPEFAFEEFRRVAGARGLESVGRRANGSTFPIDLSISEMRLAGRTHFTAIIRDATARKAAERQLRDKNSLMRTLIEGVTDPLYVQNADGRFRYVNAAMARRLGRPADACVGVSVAELVDPAARAAMEAADRRALGSNGPVTYEETIQPAGGGEPAHFLATKLPFHDADGEPAGFVGFARDITSLKKAEQALRRSERLIRDVMDRLPVAVVALTPDGKVAETNAAARDVFALRGVAADVVRGLSWRDMPWASTPELRVALEAALRRAGGGETANLVNVPSGVGRATFDLTLAPMPDDRGALQYIILTAVNVTERRAAEELARQQQAELAHLERVQTMGHMASGLAHELNQPLGSIVNYAGAARRLVAGGEIDAAGLDGILGDTIAEASRAGEIIRRLRKFVEKQRPQAQSTDLRTVISEALRILAFETRRIGLVPVVYLASDLPSVSADAVQVGQVLVNLVRNAIDAMRDLPAPQRSLRVSAERDATNFVRVSISDTGTGVADGQLERLFDAFYTTKTHGLGMGLALCRMIIADHGGQIWAERNTPSGLTFSFTLRIADESEEHHDRGGTKGVSG